MNKENFSSWKYIMWLHLSRTRDNVTHSLDTEYTILVTAMTVEQIIEKINNSMIEIAPTQNDVKFDDIKKSTNAK